MYAQICSDISTVEKIQLGAFLGCAIGAFLAIVLKSSPGSWRFFLAGGLCAAFSHTIPTPIDVVKVSAKNLVIIKYKKEQLTYYCVGFVMEF